MKRVIRPIPKNEEIQLNPYKTIMSKTDQKGIIEYANDYFMEVSGYKEWELMGQPHNILRHPEMPKLVFKLLWENLNRAKPMLAIVKNLAKDGRYYWVIADFKTKIDSQGNLNHFARRKAIPEATKAKVEKLYRNILEIEKTAGLDASKAYFEGLLEDSGVDYNTFIHNLMNLNPVQLHDYMSSEISDDNFVGKIEHSAEDAIKTTTKKKGLFGKLFS
jgi:PAS domain S-box-containing protein